MNKERKLQWIKALKDTVKMYREAIKKGISYFNYKCDNKASCPLCVLAKDNAEIDKYTGDYCDNCIHCTDYSENMVCVKHSTFHQFSVDPDVALDRVKDLNLVIENIEADL